MLAGNPRQIKAAVDAGGTLPHNAEEMAELERKWRLADLVDFEARLRQLDEEADWSAERRRYREAAGKIERWPRPEAGRRRLGLRVWLETSRARSAESGGARVASAIAVTGIILGVLSFLAGIGVMRGLLHHVDIIGRGYNIWIFLGVCLVLQWVILLGGIAGYALVRRQSGALSLFQRGAMWFVRRVAGGRDAGWRELLETSAGYRSALSWRVARLTQGAAVGFNLGLMAGFLGCLWVLKVGFYWESTLAVSGAGLLEFLQGMARPWAWTGIAPAPSSEDIEFALLPKFFFERSGSGKMWPFLLMSLAVYGLLPRLLLWVFCWSGERRALARVDFLAPRHRDLWRHLSKAERELPTSGQADGVVLLDVGGLEISTESLRGFLLRELRVNPQARYTAAVLDEDREKEALAAIRKAELGVVFLVEGWALSPKQITALYQRVREVGGEELPVHFLVLGELSDDRAAAPDGEEWEQWKRFVDSLRDPAAEAVAYRASTGREGEG